VDYFVLININRHCSSVFYLQTNLRHSRV